MPRPTIIAGARQASYMNCKSRPLRFRKVLILPQHCRLYRLLLCIRLYRRARFGHAFFGWRLLLRIRLWREKIRTCRRMVCGLVELLYLDLCPFVRLFHRGKPDPLNVWTLPSRFRTKILACLCVLHPHRMALLFCRPVFESIITIDRTSKSLLGCWRCPCDSIGLCHHA